MLGCLGSGGASHGGGLGGELLVDVGGEFLSVVWAEEAVDHQAHADGSGFVVVDACDAAFDADGDVFVPGEHGADLEGFAGLEGGVELEAHAGHADVVEVSGPEVAFVAGAFGAEQGVHRGERGAAGLAVVLGGRSEGQGRRVGHGRLRGEVSFSVTLRIVCRRS